MGNKVIKVGLSTSRLLLVGSMLMLIAVVALVMFFLNGRIVVTGEYNGQTVTETMSCESSTMPYSIFEYDNAGSKNLRINVVFDGNSINSMSLMYRLYYDSDDEIKFSEARNHSAMNQSFDQDGLEADAMNAKYSILDDGIQFSIYADDGEINEKTLKYFMIKFVSNKKNLTKEKLAKIYNDAGLNCIIKQ